MSVKRLVEQSKSIPRANLCHVRNMQCDGLETPAGYPIVNQTIMVSSVLSALEIGGGFRKIYLNCFDILLRQA
jgi:hypothetical protein